MIHCYADDSQVYIYFSPNDRAEQLAVVRNMEDCIRDIRFWMLNNDLNINLMTTRLNSLSLVHHNSWKIQIISVYVWVTQIFIPCHSQEILVVGLILGQAYSGTLSRRNFRRLKENLVKMLCDLRRFKATLGDLRRKR